MSRQVSVILKAVKWGENTEEVYVWGFGTESRWNLNISPIFFYLVYSGQLLAIGHEGDQASSQVDQAADLQVRVGAAGGSRIDGIPRTNHVTVAPLDTAEIDTALQNWKKRHMVFVCPELFALEIKLV